MTKQDFAELRRLIKTLAGGTIFQVVFTKRTTGELRAMNCRLGTRNKVKGEAGLGAAYDALEKGLMPVWDIQNNGWRSIPLDAIHEITIRGITYNSAGEAKPKD